MKGPLGTGSFGMLENAALHAALRLAKRGRSRAPSGVKRSLVVAPSNWGSVGDQAIVRAVLETLKTKLGHERCGLVFFGGREEWSALPHADEAISIDRYIDGGSARDLIGLAHAMRRYTHFYLLGTDILDGYYSEHRTLRRLTITQLAARAGLHATLVGFSIGPSPRASCIDAFQALDESVRVCCRDEVSRDRLLVHIGDRIDLTADAAFLLTPDESSPSAKSAIDWIARERGAGRLVLGINVNHHLVRDAEPGKLDELIGSYATSLTAVADALPGGTSYVFLPHDFRDPHDDRKAGRSLLGQLAEDLRPHSMMLAEPFNAAEVKGVAGHLDAVISGRMHVAIASLGRATPTGCLTYLGKFEGLFRHFGLSGTELSPEEALHSEALVKFVHSIVDRREELRRQVEERLPHVTALARSNLVAG